MLLDTVHTLLIPIHIRICIIVLCVYISFIHIDFKPCITEWDYVVYDCVCVCSFLFYDFILCQKWRNETVQSICMAYLRTKWFRHTEERCWVQAPATNINFRFNQGRIFHQNVNISVEANPRRALKLPCIPISVALFNIPGIRTTLLMLLPNFMGFTHFH